MSLRRRPLAPSLHAVPLLLYQRLSLRACVALRLVGRYLTSPHLPRSLLACSERSVGVWLPICCLSGTRLPCVLRINAPAAEAACSRQRPLPLPVLNTRHLRLASRLTSTDLLRRLGRHDARIIVRGGGYSRAWSNGISWRA